MEKTLQWKIKTHAQTLTSCVLICVGDEFDERIVRVAVQVMSVPRFLGRDFYTGFSEHLGYGSRDFTEMCVVRVRVQKSHLRNEQ